MSLLKVDFVEVGVACAVLCDGLHWIGYLDWLCRRIGRIGSATSAADLWALCYVPTTQVPLLATILGLPTGTTGTVHRGRVCLLKGRAGMVPTVSASGTASSPATRPARARSTPTEPTESGAKAGAGASAGGSRGWVDAAVLETSIADFLLPFIPPGRYCRSGLATSVVRLPEQQDILPAVRSCTAKWKVASEEVLQSGEPQTSIPCSAALSVACALSLFKLRLPVPGTAACACRGRVHPLRLPAHGYLFNWLLS